MAGICRFCNKEIKNPGNRQIHPFCIAREKASKAKDTNEITPDVEQVKPKAAPAPKKSKEEKVRFIIMSSGLPGELKVVEGGIGGEYFRYERDIEHVALKRNAEYLSSLTETVYDPIYDSSGNRIGHKPRQVRKYPVQILGSA